MNHLSDNHLRLTLKSLASSERETLHKILVHLRELDRRKLFSKDGFPSLRAYAMQELKYSEDQADRRIAAMRLLRDMPEAEKQIKDGTLTLSSLAQAQWHFQRAKCTKEEKKEILIKLQNATKKQTRAILKQEDKVRFVFEATEDEEKMIERLRALNPHLNFNELMIKVCRLAQDKQDPEKKIERAELRLEKKIERAELRAERKISQPGSPEDLGPSSEARSARAAGAQSFTSAGKVTVASVPKGIPIRVGPMIPTSAGKVGDSNGVQSKRYIAADVKRQVWKNSNGKCQNCSSAYALEYDHIVAFAKGGTSTVENLRMLCRSCNQREAIEQFGMKKMAQYLRAPAMKYLN